MKPSALTRRIKPLFSARKNDFPSAVQIRQGKTCPARHVEFGHLEFVDRPDALRERLAGLLRFQRLLPRRGILELGEPTFRLIFGVDDRPAPPLAGRH